MDLEKGGGGTKEEKTKITKTYHTIKDMISSRFNKPKDNVEEQKQMNNQAVANGNERTYARGGDNAMVQGGLSETRRTYEAPELSQETGVVQRVYGSRERLIDGFPPEANQRANQRDTRVMPPLPVLRGNHHPNFSGVSEIISPIMPSSPISPQQQQRRLAQNYESEILSHQQIQRKMQNQNAGSENFSTARAHLVQTIEGSPQRPSVQESGRHIPSKPPQEPIYTSGSYLPPHQRRPPPPAAKPTYRDPRGHTMGELSHSTSNLVESQDGNITANLESNGVYISKNPNPKFSQGENYAYSQNPIYGTRPGLSIPITAEINPIQPKIESKGESETDDDGGFKRIQKDYQDSSRSLEGKIEKKNKEDNEKETHETESHAPSHEKKEAESNKAERPNSRSEILNSNDGLRNQENKVSSATSSDYEKATRRSLGQGSSLGDSGRGSAAYSSGRQDSERIGADYRDRPSGKDRSDVVTESTDGMKKDASYSQQKSFPSGLYFPSVLYSKYACLL